MLFVLLTKLSDRWNKITTGYKIYFSKKIWKLKTTKRPHKET